ncbi:MAG: putative heme d1 biosynthesis radical SAM protein NirJ2 [Thermoanaerobacteraceae bacterium]|uniref:putative heme d1 biosynthesis radical SAM protein NirJ2 n=1 Tax=Thermanaeromonas sp. C210 TaxID=2731925 RepID=UPI00155CEA80|nr:putative heme d1 biosynthesis radical SAM protein NirJ2 [Thermanaeromonas sp. C210]MBE3580977.1 putative heme d1 biosynthesis radical SAM protein NirJ2 [Thermoanaerobacteraceae bacterium]GFN23579.1 heme d1 biosynthesis radical SAM protein NirJ2 [Thermanaeromonas sp. C210]
MLISWNTTNQCNLYCDHCYRDAGARAAEELNTDEAKELIDGAVRAGFRIFIFSGGEPLLRPDLLELVTYATSQGLRVVLGTNGTLLTPDLARELRRAGARAVGISLDSCKPEKHDKLRHKTGAWQAALDGMEACRSAGLPFQVHTTVFDWNREELEELTDLAVSLGAKGHHFFFLVPTGRAASLEEEALRAEEYEETIRTVLWKQQQVNIELKPTCAPQFMRLAREMGLSLPYSRGCLAGIAYCLVGPRGHLQPCAYLNLEIGNVREIPLDRLWQESEVLKKLRGQDYGGVCGRCRYRTLCGGCRARAYCFSGDYMAADPWCRYYWGKEERVG